MPRSARKKSASGYYHVIIRGNGKMTVFNDNFDYNFFIKLMWKYSQKYNIKIVAYCLMRNHVHFLIHDSSNDISDYMHCLTGTYASYFNKRHSHTGHVFQGRFLNEIIDDERYFLTVFRYILNNPHKAGICSTKDYPWSSYKDYFYANRNTDLLLVRKLIGSEENYTKFITAENKDDCMEYEPVVKDDAWAKKILHEQLGYDDGKILAKLNDNDKRMAVRKLKDIGLSFRQIERLTGINRSEISVFCR